MIQLRKMILAAACLCLLMQPFPLGVGSAAEL